MKKTPTAYVLLVLFLLLSSCTFNASLKGLLSETGKTELTPSASLQKIFVDITDVTIIEGSVAIINVAVNPVRNEDTTIYLTLSSNSSSYIRFNPIPSQITIPAGSTSKSVVLNTLDDSLVQDQENWKFSIASIDPTIHADPGVLNITLNDNDGGAIPGSPVSSGPKLLKEFNPYPTSVNKIAALGRIFYVGTDAANGSELWISDGTADGTKLLKDIEPGTGSSAVTSFFHPPTSPYVFFTASTASEGTELWRTDGTEQGTQLIKDLEPGSTSSTINILMVNGDKLYFNATTTLDGKELYVSDGTSNGTRILFESVAGSTGTNGNSIIADGADIYFSDYNYNTSEGRLYKTDGNPSNITQLVTATSDGHSFFDTMDLEFVYNGRIYFSGYAGYGYELYSTAGSNATTFLLRDFYSGSSSSYASSSAQMILNSKVLVSFSWDSSGTATGYYLTDGTPAGTGKVTQSVTTSLFFGVIGGTKVVYSGCVNNYNCELYASSGVNGDAVLLKDINPGSNGGNANSSSPALAAKIGNKMFFTATNATEGLELYVTDGTQAGTLLLKDIYAGTTGSSPSNFIVAGSYLIFTAKSNIYGEELWVSDGTPSGTVLYKDLIPGTAGSGPKNFALLDSTHLFFTAYNSLSHFASVFITDLSSYNTTGIAHAMVESLNSETKNIVEYNGLVYFDAMDANSGNPLWVTNGTVTGTAKIKDLYPNITCSDINYMTVYNNSLFFVASSEASGSELYVSDGTTAGTNIIKEIATGSTGSSIASLTKTDLGKMFFSANDNSGAGNELFASDGTASGTGLLKDLNTAASASSYPQNFYGIPGTNKVIFYTTNPYGFWVSDGTSAGTVQMSGLSTISSIPYIPMVTTTGAFFTYTETSTYKQRIYFVNATTNVATHLNTSYTTDTLVGSPFLNSTSQTVFYATSNSSLSVLNLWKSDGTVSGTTLFKNIPISGNNFSVTHMGNLGNKSFFQYANNTSAPYVRELWVTDGTDIGTRSIDSASNSISVNYTAGFEFNGFLYFTRYHASAGVELWKTDGTSGNTVMVKDINSGPGSSGASMLAVYNGNLYFSANDGSHGVELWRTDGSLLGTELVADINPGSNNSNPTKLKVLAGKLYFTAVKVLSGTELWVYSD